jgi:hypothetical protein
MQMPGVEAAADLTYVRYWAAMPGGSTQSGVIVETVLRTHSKKAPLVNQAFTDASIGRSIFGHVANSGMTPVRPDGSRGACG